MILAFDDLFADHAIACLNSIHVNYPSPPEILVQYSGHMPAALAAIERVSGRLLDVPVNIRRDFYDAPAGPVGSPLVYDRLRIWSDEFDDYDNVLYLDTDTLVLQTLDDLLAENRFVAVSNHEPTTDVRVFHSDSAGDSRLRALLDEDGLAFPGGMDDMVNAGVMLVPRHCRGRGAYASLLRLYHRYRAHLHFADQSLISLWCAANGIAPDRRYTLNYQSPFFTDPGVDVAFEDIRVLHFSSHRKPCTDAFRSWPRLGDAAPRCEDLYRHYRYLR